MRRTLPLLVLVLGLGCGDSGSATSGGGGGGTTTGSGGSGTTGSGGSTTGSGGGSTTGGCPEGGAPPGTGGGVEACTDIGAQDCFSNYDCPTGQRCENVGTDTLPTACCVDGERGSGPLGQGCLGELDCGSGLCVEGGPCGYTCSDTCTTDGDCPAALPNCIVIAFSGTNDKFCTP